MSSSPSSPAILSAYATLTSLLHPTAPLEIEILPSSISTTILHAGNSIGIPKRLLTACFPHARSTFLAHKDDDDDDNQQDDDRQEAATTKTPALDATLVLQLLNPEHISAANFRKRRLLLWRRNSGREDNDDGSALSCTREMVWIESLVTSPLYRHAKSPTLWAHRLWVLKTFLHSSSGSDEGNGDGRGGAAAGLLARELGVVMRAGERHAGNYHAWNYAREVLTLVAVLGSAEVHEGLKAVVEKVHGWCLAHPRDISGWSFLAFLLRGQAVDGHVARHVYGETEAFAERVRWQGSSVEWFLASEAQIRDSRTSLMAQSRPNRPSLSGNSSY
ncbi:MAG: hypothetical protein LQ345_004385 [Seirophora villosa]|nr:MAG: hypothetical protein LQ345_004385 [Seirophora villosa]